MMLITLIRETIAKHVNELASLIRTYRTVAERAPAWHQQVVKAVTQRVLESSEIRNALSYAVKMTPNDLLSRAVDHSEDFLMLANSPMTVLTAYRRGSYSVFKENLLHTLSAHARNPPETAGPKDFLPQSSPTVSRSESSLSTLNDIAVAFGRLTTPLAASLAVLIYGSAFLLIAINIGLALAIGGYVLIVDIAFVLIGAILFYLIIQGTCGRWTIAEASSDILMRTEIAPFIREQVNAELRRANLQDSFHITVAPALTELSDREQVVETRTMQRLRMSLNTMAYGSIGVSGIRGTGKSVLLRAFCDERFGQPDVPELGLMVSAPVDYDGRDFIIHLFSSLCLKVIKLAGTPGRASPLRPIAINLYQLGIVVGGFMLAIEAGVKLSHKQIALGERALIAGIVIIAALAILSRFTGMNPMAVRFTIRRKAPAEGGHMPSATATAVRERRAALTITGAVFIIMIIAGAIFVDSNVYISAHSVMNDFPKTKRFWPGIAVLAAALAIGAAMSFTSRKRSSPHPRNIADLASEYLHRMESIRTVTTGQSATLGIPSRIQLNRSWANQLTERDLTLPAIVDLYRDYTTNVVAWWRSRHGGQGRIIIGIDELDKITDTKSAERFLNEIKAVFGTPGCLYIVSTSEDALLQFEKKSLGFRSVFDSTFDDIIRTDSLSPATTRDLLLSRLAGIADPFIILCHVLSGGLPRDVLRTARVIVEARCSGCVSLKEICIFLISREIADLKKGLIVKYGSKEAVQGRPPLEATLVEALRNDEWPGTDSGELLAVATPTLRNISPQMHSALCFLATVYDVAVNENGVPWAGFFIPGIMEDALHDLAGARSWLSSSPDTARELVRAARLKLNLRPIE